MNTFSNMAQKGSFWGHEEACIHNQIITMGNNVKRTDRETTSRIPINVILPVYNKSGTTECHLTAIKHPSWIDYLLCLVQKQT